MARRTIGAGSGAGFNIDTGGPIYQRRPLGVGNYQYNQYGPYQGGKDRERAEREYMLRQWELQQLPTQLAEEQITRPDLVGYVEGRQGFTDYQGDINRLRGIAEGGSPVEASPFADFLMQQSDLSAQGQQEAAQRQAQTSQAARRRQLGMFGGMAGGASERIARSGSEAEASTLQDLRRQAQERRMGILGQDLAGQQQFQRQIQASLPGMGLQESTLFGNLAGQQRGFEQDFINQQLQFRGGLEQARSERALGFAEAGIDEGDRWKYLM